MPYVLAALLLILLGGLALVLTPSVQRFAHYLRTGEEL